MRSGGIEASAPSTATFGDLTLPIVVDPSHGTGRRNKVLPLSRAAIAVGADGILVEVHHDPAKALSDGPQSILPEEFTKLVHEAREIAAVLGRTLN